MRQAVAHAAQNVGDGAGVIATITVFLSSLEPVSKGIMGVMMVVWFGYRIYNLRLDAQKKKKDLEKD